MQVNPPDSRDAEETPLVCFAEEAAGGEKADGTEPDKPGEG